MYQHDDKHGTDARRSWLRRTSVVGLVLSGVLLVLGVRAGATAEMEGALFYHEGEPAEPPVFLEIGEDDPSLVVLPPAAQAAPEQLEKMNVYNGMKPGVTQNGFQRGIKRIVISLGEEVLAKAKGLHEGGTVDVVDDVLVWTARLSIEDAYAFRLHLEKVTLSPEAKIWVFTPQHWYVGPFGAAELDPEGSLWLPPVYAATALLQVQVPLTEAAGARPVAFEVGELVELFDLRASALKSWSDCSVDISCVGFGGPRNVDNLKSGIALLTFNDGGSSYQCTGALLRSGGSQGEVPYLLTANHCFDSQASASSLVASFDDFTDECDGQAPDPADLDTVNGATLLATDPGSDFTLVRLSAIPKGYRYYFGWTTEIPLEPQLLYRISHPAGTPQKYSTSRFTTSGFICDGVPRERFHYSTPEEGSTIEGSSGAPLFTFGDQIVGQLMGACHAESWDACNYETFDYIDGSFAATFPYISDYLLAGPTCSADLYEAQGSDGSDDTCQGAFIAFDSPQVHTFCDADWVWFNGTAGSVYRVEVTDIVGDAWLNMSLHINGGEATVTTSGNDKLELEFMAPEDARYDVQLFDEWYGYATGEGYTITATCLSNCDDAIFSDGFETGDLSAW